MSRSLYLSSIFVNRMRTQFAGTGVRQAALRIRFAASSKVFLPLAFIMNLLIVAVPLLPEQCVANILVRRLSLVAFAVYPAILLSSGAVFYPYSEDVTRMARERLSCVMGLVCVCCAFEYSVSIASMTDQPLLARVAVWSRAIGETAVIIAVATAVLRPSAPFWALVRSLFPLLASLYLACCICVSGACGEQVSLPGVAGSLTEAVVLWCCWSGAALAVNNDNRVQLSQLAGLHVLNVPLEHIDTNALTEASAGQASADALSSRRSHSCPKPPVSEDSSWDGLPSEVLRSLIADGLLIQNDTHGDGAGGFSARHGFHIDGTRTREPVANLSGCGGSTLGTNSEIGGYLDADG